MGGIGMNDMLLIVLIASAATNALAGKHKSIVSGIVLIATVILWSYLFNLLAFHFESLHKLFIRNRKWSSKTAKYNSRICKNN